jgi:hypothetical protein
VMPFPFCASEGQLQNMCISSPATSQQEPHERLQGDTGSQRMHPVAVSRTRHTSPYPLPSHAQLSKKLTEPSPSTCQQCACHTLGHPSSPPGPGPPSQARGNILPQEAVSYMGVCGQQC